jgi:hypothetical protein
MLTVEPVLNGVREGISPDGKAFHGAWCRDEDSLCCGAESVRWFAPLTMTLFFAGFALGALVWHWGVGEMVRGVYP